MRLKEFAIRLALGEAPGRLARRVLGQGVRWVALAALLGGAAALWLSHYVGGLLFQVDARDPLPLVGAALVLLLVALMATFLPAHRASRVEPAALLQEE